MAASGRTRTASGSGRTGGSSRSSSSGSRPGSRARWRPSRPCSTGCTRGPARRVGQAHRPEPWRRSSRNGPRASASASGSRRRSRASIPRRGLLEWQWPDGGWNCDRRARPPFHSSANESLPAAWGLHEYARGHRRPAAAAAADRAAEFFLVHHVYRSHRSGRVLMPSVTTIHWPPYWHYDLLQGLLILARMGRAGDPRAADAIERARAAAPARRHVARDEPLLARARPLGPTRTRPSTGASTPTRWRRSTRCASLQVGRPRLIGGMAAAPSRSQDRPALGHILRDRGSRNILAGTSRARIPTWRSSWAS